MSDHDEVIARLDWLTEAVKVLLKQIPVAYQPESTVAEYEGDTDEDAAMAEQLEATRAVQPVVPVCTHRHQGIVGGHLRCIDCGFTYGQSGANVHVQS
jgi:hypothetical protein